MTPSYIIRFVGEGGAARRPAADYIGKQVSADCSSKQNEQWKERPSLFNLLYYYKVTWA